MPFEIVRDVEAYVKVHLEIPRAQVYVLEKLAKYANATSRCAYPSIATLAELTRYSIRTVQRALRSLEENKLIKSCLQLSKYGTVIYQILVPRKNSAKSRGDTMTPNPHNVEKGEKKDTRTRAHAPEVEIRQKTRTELEQLSGKEKAERFLKSLRTWVGDTFYNACVNGNSHEC